ncbi:MAG: conjugal transfer transcriptional regulator TraJ [Prosthecobacter sp.]|nr:conjugal transfer transcriptional regulator TraJ [Prosthecobacter sp.]
MQKPDEQKQPTRKDSPPIKVYCLPVEKEQIAAKADAAGMSQSNYLLSVGLGYEVQSVIDSRLVVELAKVNADQGRLGGLLKLWLTNDERFAGFDEGTMRATIKVVLSRIEETQGALLEIANRGLKF